MSHILTCDIIYLMACYTDCADQSDMQHGHLLRAASVTMDVIARVKEIIKCIEFDGRRLPRINSILESSEVAASEFREMRMEAGNKQSTMNQLRNNFAYHFKSESWNLSGLAALEIADGAFVSFYCENGISLHKTAVYFVLSQVSGKGQNSEVLEMLSDLVDYAHRCAMVTRRMLGILIDAYLDEFKAEEDIFQIGLSAHADDLSIPYLVDMTP